MKKIILYLWQLPQNLIGLFIILIMRATKMYEYANRTFIFLCPLFYSGVSLGNYIILDDRCGPFSNNDIMHEQGHQKQSLYLGWLYLLIIGIPSIVGNILRRFFVFDYYSLLWEKWADKLGGVER